MLQDLLFVLKLYDTLERDLIEFVSAQRNWASPPLYDGGESCYSDAWDGAH